MTGRFDSARRLFAALCGGLALCGGFGFGANPAQAQEVGRELPESRKEAPTLLIVTPGGLTAEQVAKRALASSRSVRVKQAELEAARAKIAQTTVAFFPRLTLGASYTRLSPVSAGFGSGALVGAQNAGLLSTGPCPQGGGSCVLDAAGEPVGAAAFAIEQLENNYALTASLVVPLSDYVTSLSRASAAAQANRDAARLAVEAEKLKAMSDARVLFYAWARTKAQKAVAEKSLARNRALLTDAETAYTLGTVSKVDVLRLKALVSAAEHVVSRADASEALARAQLALVMDAAPEERARFAVGEDVVGSGPYDVGETLPRLISEAQARRLELQALQKTAESLRHGARANVARRYPRIDGFADLTYANPNQRYFPPQQQWNTTWSVGVSATWTVNDFFSGGAVVDELEQNANAVEAQRDALSQAIEQEVTAALLERDSARVGITTAAEALKASEEAYRVAIDLYQVGRATTTELIDAESELVRALSALLDAHTALRMTEARLWHAVGRDQASGGPRAPGE